jgi:hypothetical protein
MRWGDFRRSENVEDATGDGRGGFPGGRGLKLGGGALVLIVIASLLFGVNPLEMIGMLETGPVVQAPPGSAPPSRGSRSRGGSPRDRPRRS